ATMRNPNLEMQSYLGIFQCPAAAKLRACMQMQSALRKIPLALKVFPSSSLLQNSAVMFGNRRYRDKKIKVKCDMNLHHEISRFRLDYGVSTVMYRAQCTTTLHVITTTPHEWQSITCLIIKLSLPVMNVIGIIIGLTTSIDVKIKIYDFAQSAYCTDRSFEIVIYTGMRHLHYKKLRITAQLQIM
ncbi:hypothetical protein N5P37_009386, partial [Trichoderma harzianum]